MSASQKATPRILIADARAERRSYIAASLSDLEHRLIEAGSTGDALKALKRSPFDLILMDLACPEGGAIEFCRQVRQDQAINLTPIFVLASSADARLEADASHAGVDELLTGPLTPSAVRARVLTNLTHTGLMRSLGDAESSLFSLAKFAEGRDPAIGQHCQRLALMAGAMGLALNLPPEDIRSLQCGGYLHDIGKVGISERILLKPGKLTPDEWEVMQSHVERGERICAHAPALAPVLPIIRHHHEKFDGTGYPDGLKGEEIPLLARILQIVDIYDALILERPYKRAYTPDEALAIMRQESQKGWRDPVLVETFAELLPVFRAPQHLLASAIDRFRKPSAPSKICSIPT